MFAVRQCKLTHLIAHKAAFDAGVLHQDIRAGNIMIVDNNEPNIRGGMLINWDLSKVIDPDKSNTTRQYMCTVSKTSDAAHLPSPDISPGNVAVHGRGSCPTILNSPHFRSQP